MVLFYYFFFKPSFSRLVDKGATLDVDDYFPLILLRLDQILGFFYKKMFQVWILEAGLQNPDSSGLFGRRPPVWASVLITGCTKMKWNFENQYTHPSPLQSMWSQDSKTGLIFFLRWVLVLEALIFFQRIYFKNSSKLSKWLYFYSGFLKLAQF